MALDTVTDTDEDRDIHRAPDVTETGHGRLHLWV
jgi:hypothetical protein